MMVNNIFWRDNNEKDCFNKQTYKQQIFELV